MKNELEMTLSSRRSLTESVAREQITALADYNGGLMRPDKASEFEPIRSEFDPTDISDPVRWLANPQGQFFYRKGSPIHLSGEMWNRNLPLASRFSSPLFSNYWTGRFDGRWATRIGIEQVEDFMSEMFRVTRSDFALLTTSDDRRAKNQGPMSYSYQGADLQSGLPGLYWINFFSDELAGWLELSDIPRQLATLKRLPRGGWLLKFCESPANCRDTDILQKQEAAINWFGSNKFFDIRQPDRKLQTPDWEQSLPGHSSIVAPLPPMRS